MPIPVTAKSSKLRLTAFLDSRFTRPLQPMPNGMSLVYNPDTLSIKQENKYEDEQAASTSAPKADFYASSPRLLTVTFSFVAVDFGSYGLNPYQLEKRQENVRKQLDLFDRLCQRINGASHQPAYLRLNWSRGGLRTTFEARLKSYEENLVLMDRGERELVADLTATFVEAVHPDKQRARERLSSPDLSHRHLVLAGETLPMLCRRYYGTTDPYLQVAAFNQLDDIRDLTPGQQLLFPPLESSGGQDR